MNVLSWELSASGGAVAFLPLVVGLLVVCFLIGAFVLGRRIRAREPAPPAPEEQPRLPQDGPVREISERREPDEVPQQDVRLTPHQLKGGGTGGSRRSDDQERPKDDNNSGGAFGSGGLGG